MRILRAETYRRMPWKNGGGETAEIAVSPEGAGLDDFDWRISMARVEAGGLFSMFLGVDRTLSILEGEGMVLDIEGRKPVMLTGASAPYSFPADVITSAELIDGPITDLNVMTRRGRYGHKVGGHQVEGSLEIDLVGEQTLLFCRSGNMLVRGDSQQEELRRFDVAMLDGGEALRIEGSAQLFVIELNRI